MNKKGFSILEIILVVLILGVAAYIVGPAYSEASVESKLSALINDLDMIRAKIELYRIEHEGLWPGQYRQGGEIEASDFVNALTKGEESYLPVMPVNPFNGMDSVVISSKNEGATGEGWCFNPVTGEFRADDSDEHGSY